MEEVDLVALAKNEINGIFDKSYLLVSFVLLKVSIISYYDNLGFSAFLLVGVQVNSK